jgi:NADPH:quinone reductase-like Zn-dependent oxidoreductase
VFGVCPGAAAEYACASEAKLTGKPTELTFEQAASLPIAGLTALQGLRDDARLTARQKLLINGASGGVGTFAIQIAKSLGAHVTGVCSTKNAEMVRSLGADRVIDYTREDFTRAGERYDAILDLVGNRTFADCRGIMTERGVFISAGGPGPEGLYTGRWMTGLITGFVMRPFVGQRLAVCMAAIRPDDLTALAELVTSGKVNPVIDNIYRLSEIRDAMRHQISGRARGKIVIVP